MGSVRGARVKITTASYARSTASPWLDAKDTNKDTNKDTSQ